MEDQDGNVTTDPVADFVDNTTDDYTDTQVENVETSPTVDTSGYEDAEDAENVSQSAPENNGIPEKQAEAERREEGKLRQVQKELEELREVKARYDVIQKNSQEDPEFFKQALMKINKVSEQDALATINELRSQGLWKQAQQVAQETQPGIQTTIDPNLLVEMATQRFEQRHEAKTTLEVLMSTYPELERTGKSQEQIIVNQKLIETADYLANAKMQKDLKLNRTEAVIQAYGEITGKAAAQVTQARENGRLEGLAQATARAGASSTAPVGQQSLKTSVNLTTQERAYAQAMKMTDEEYYRFGQSKETYAE